LATKKKKEIENLAIFFELMVSIWLLSRKKAKKSAQICPNLPKSAIFLGLFHSFLPRNLVKILVFFQKILSPRCWALFLQKWLKFTIKKKWCYKLVLITQYYVKYNNMI
jgi:hypothetical protein